MQVIGYVIGLLPLDISHSLFEEQRESSNQIIAYLRQVCNIESQFLM